MLAAICSVPLSFHSAWADPAPCDFPGQKQMLLVQLFMGLDMPGNATITAKAWDAFLASVVTPRFPDGFTVYNAYGQWWNPQTGSIVQENSKVIVIAVAERKSTRAKVSEVANAYKNEFRQISVGIVSSRSCASF